ncbi:MAG: polysaccharide deacetylase family protein, partial [Acidobacteriia bacterium]|nr:polysaccharide deacetylase family protein [Terriglobia bacterium]
MNASSRIVLWALMGLLFPLQIASAQDHQITPWKHNYAAAASLGFDDGLPSQVDYAVPLLNARGLKATFFVVPSGVPVIPTGGDVTWDQWRQVAAQGHEIGSQSFSDPDLTTLTDSDLRYQLSQSQLVINQNIPSQSCITLAYPFGTSNSHVQAVTSEYYATGRGAWAELEGGDLNFYEDPDPAWPLPPNVDLGSYKAVNFFDIAGNNLRDTLPLSNIYNKLDFAIAHNAWYDMYVHDIDSGFSSDDLAALLDYIVARNIWMARLGEVAQYMRERKESTLSVLSSDSSAIQLSLTNSLNGLLYTESLTIRSIVPSAWLNVSITQGSSSTTIASTVEGASTVVYYDALPNGGTIVLTQAGPLSGVSMSPATVQGGVSSTGTVTLNTPAPAGGAVVSLTSSDTAAARVPALVTVLAGATTATFTATTSPVASNETVTITALYNSVSRTATLTVTVTAPVAALSGVSVSPTSVQGGASSTGTVTLDAPAPAGGAAVSLTSSNTAAAQVPGSVTVLAGATTAAFTATTSPVASDAAVTITALYNSVSRTATLTVTAPAPAPDFSLSAIPASQAVLQGTPGSYTLTINPTNGFTGAVTLSVSGLPAGATGSFTPNPATGSSTLAVTTSSSTPVGTYTLTVTGVSGSLNHTTTVSLSVVTTLPPPGVAFDAVGPSAGGASVASGSSLSWNHTVGANGMNLLLMVGVAVGAMPDTGHSLAVTYNSVPMTSVGIVHSNNQTYGYVQLFYLTAPAVGTYPVQVTLSGGTASLEAGSVSFTGVDPTTPVRNIATSFGSGVSPKVTVTSTPGDMVVDALVTGCNGTITSGKTLRWLKQVNCATAGGNGAQSTAAGASSVTMGYTVPSDSWGMIGADIVAAGGQPIDFTL